MTGQNSKINKTILHFTLLFSILIFTFYIFIPRAYALNIAARISDQSTEIIGGDRLYFEVEIKYPENPRRKDLRIEYQIIENGELIASEKVLRAVETQASFLDYIVVPQSTKSGIKELNVIITDYEDLHKEVSATFKVLKGRNQTDTYFFILLGSILLVAALVIIQIRATRRRA
ncbi:MAG: hypothetical protein UY16_C0048G0003 [Candidatus Gottesmanbacteria bacterium GW2011_GWA2_47_9]|uniref:Uncharacterized protein n=1 Tax=Candidatus Gottesmanbacteria bacterium GW2011_GWA2_47_9 TaxID=1618445 RepID=A0A0G1W8W4_9BACT|nr:MAG: hypothetical protein UY16_C0048G0003 [Candidatus Gottesmanbacteria bacterium GW2011_GWA2_47_9]